MKQIDVTKAQISIESQNGQFFKYRGWDKPFRSTSVDSLKKYITQTTREIEEAMVTLEVLPRELMELKAELGSRKLN